MVYDVRLYDPLGREYWRTFPYRIEDKAAQSRLQSGRPCIG